MNFPEWSTPLIADACMRLAVPLRIAPPGLRPITTGMRAAGPVRPVRHFGSVDVFLEVLVASLPGEVLVIDNGGRLDEGCIGDLTVLEVQAHGLAGVLVWGAHRDTAELRAIGLPVFSYGASPAGPRAAEPREADALIRARVGGLAVTAEDEVFADDDGAVFLPRARRDEILLMARKIWTKERAQAEAVRAGTTLKAQLGFEDFLQRREQEPGWTFRQHLRERGGAIEE